MKSILKIQTKLEITSIQLLFLSLCTYLQIYSHFCAVRRSVLRPCQCRATIYGHHHQRISYTMYKPIKCAVSDTNTITTTITMSNTNTAIPKVKCIRMIMWKKIEQYIFMGRNKDYWSSFFSSLKQFSSSNNGFEYI